MIIEPQFQIFNDNFSLIEISRIKAGKMIDNKQDGFVIIYSIILFGIGIKLIFGGETGQRFVNKIGKQ